jgi:hypothetical protein
MAETILDGLKALNAVDLSALRARIEAMKALAEKELSTSAAAQEISTTQLVAALERAKKIGII